MRSRKNLKKISLCVRELRIDLSLPIIENKEKINEMLYDYSDEAFFNNLPSIRNNFINNDIIVALKDFHQTSNLT